MILEYLAFDRDVSKQVLIGKNVPDSCSAPFVRVFEKGWSFGNVQLAYNGIQRLTRNEISSDALDGVPMIIGDILPFLLCFTFKRNPSRHPLAKRNDFALCCLLVLGREDGINHF
jgi:hypothetical protein